MYILLIYAAQPGAAADVTSAWCLRWYILRRRFEYNEPNLEQSAKRLTRQSLGHLGNIKGRVSCHL
jgi:hypothetical protein